MLTIHSRHLLDLRFDPGSSSFQGCVHLRYSLSNDPDVALSARIRVQVSLPRKSRFGHIESAMIDSALLRLRTRLEEVETAPCNIFAADLTHLSAAA